MTAQTPPATSVLGLGNVLMGDDALGPHVIARLQAGYEFPPGVTVNDLGTPGLDLLPYLDGCEALIVVDTVRAEGAAGELRLYRRDEILRHPPQARTSPHDPGLKEALLALEFAGEGPEEVMLVGVIPDDVSSRVGLAEPVRAAVGDALQAVLDELARLGHGAVRRESPGEPDLWWEKP